MYGVTKQLYINKSGCIKFEILNKQTCGDGGKEKLPKRIRGRNLKGNQTQKGNSPSPDLDLGRLGICVSRGRKHSTLLCST